MFNDYISIIYYLMEITHGTNAMKNCIQDSVYVLQNYNEEYVVMYLQF